MNLKNLLRGLKPKVGTNSQDLREIWLEKTLSDIPEGSRILDAGAGTQRYRSYCSHLRYVSQDFGQYNVSGDGVGLHSDQFDYGELDIVSDIVDIPEETNSFDAVMCVEVLEHLPHPDRAIKEFGRLLRPGGMLVITAPFCSLTHMAPYHFCSGFSRYWFERQLSDYDFEILGIYPNGNYFEYLAQEVYRIPSISKRYSHDRPRIWEWISMILVQKMLSRFSSRDEGSSEVLCYGFHVVAVKS
ncbi:MAG: SAM-dependent methyltransferase [Chloroflexi bacterium]|nr:SAM-dependent methyltransferase [Chloroflexota bacterium]|tara:strand:+ start:2470 stop:3198 length:729 start_codon:yes stop_codon:yes gene_type:complete